MRMEDKIWMMMMDINFESVEKKEFPFLSFSLHSITVQGRTDGKMHFHKAGVGFLIIILFCMNIYICLCRVHFDLERYTW